MVEDGAYVRCSSLVPIPSRGVREHGLICSCAVLTPTSFSSIPSTLQFSSVFGKHRGHDETVKVLFVNESDFPMRCTLSQRQHKVQGDIGPGVKGAWKCADIWDG